jgi:Importin, protein involved in nuclear import
LIPSLFLTPKDEDDWNENPIEFIRKEEDVTECSNNLKRILRDLFKRICDMNLCGTDGESLLMKFMKYSAYVLTNNVDPRTNQPTDLRMKEAIMHIIGTLAKPILKNDSLKSNMEYLLHKYVVPEFHNPIGFLRARACWVFGIYAGFEFENKQILADATEGLYKCLTDNQLPVQVKAGIALNQILQQEEVINLLKPGLSSILSTYLKLISEIDEDELVLALEGIVASFQSEIQPFALEIIEHLANIFFQANKDDENDDTGSTSEEDERQMGAAGCLSTIATVLKSGIPKDALSKSEDIIMPILDLAFTQKGEDFTEAGLQILSAITYHSDIISDKMWTYFLELNYMILGKNDGLQQQDDGWAFDYIQDMIPSFQNYIQKGRNIIFSVKDPYYHLTYIELLFKTIDKLYDYCYDSQSDVEMVIASVLYITLIENYVNEIDDIVRFILDKSIFHLPKAKSIMMKKMFIQIISMCLWYNTALTLSHLENKQATEYVFKSWIELFPSFKHDFELRRLLFGLASILRLNVNDLPAVFNYFSLINELACFRFSCGIPTTNGETN